LPAFVGAGLEGAAFLGDSLLLAKWEPTELSKNPPTEEGFVGEECLGAGAAFLGDSDLLANWEPTELSKKPPPEEAFVGEDCLGAGAAFLGDSLLLANWAPTELSKNPLEEPAAQHSLSESGLGRAQANVTMSSTAKSCGSVRRLVAA